MQPIVTHRTYEFVPPYHGYLWPWLLKYLIPGYLRNQYGVTDVEFRGAEKLRDVFDSGQGVLLAPNHSRMADALVMQLLSRHLGRHFFIMASSHLFYTGKRRAWVIRRAGAFSVYREGVDREAVKAAIDILAQARRPLVLFPEGSLSHSNDRLNALMAGVSMIARSAARRRARTDGAAGKIVVVPVAIKYLFKGELRREIEPMLEEIEARLSWRPQRELGILERIYKAGGSLLTLKEMEFFGAPRPGTLPERLEGLIDHLLGPLEETWLQGRQDGSVITRVKELRKAVLPEMIEGDLPEDEGRRRWRHLEDMYLAQQLSLYPSNYIASKPTVDRMLETTDKFQENLTGREQPHAPTTAVVEIGEPISVDQKARRDEGGDPLLLAIEGQLGDLLAALADESQLYEDGDGG
ncbi:MAG: 1-acyl-sn-glycerol-3-phosphate acyltransferase [Planctomycetota bacterium]|nr:1-acyl-sn-glycerol-3-phosphate acyltransferase [Planctomycetota bacterium]